MPYWFDGNNIIGLSAAMSRERPRLQQAFLSTLSGYRRSGGGRFLVYFDGDGLNHSVPPPGITVRYSAPLSADDAIVRRLREIHRPSEVIVVSNDLELQSRCRAAAAKVMSWQQFDSRMQSRKKRRPADSPQAVDVEEWMEYFGIEGGDAE